MLDLWFVRTASRHVSMLNQLLDFRLIPQSFVQNFNTWEAIKVKYDKQTGTALPDNVLLAALLNKTRNALQKHLRLNAYTLTTYEDIRSTMLECHHSRHRLTGASSSSRGQGTAPMDIGVEDLKESKASAKVVLATSKERKEKERKEVNLEKVYKGKQPRMNVHSAAMAKRTGKDKGNQNFAVSMLWFAGLVKRAAMWRRSALRAV